MLKLFAFSLQLFMLTIFNVAFLPSRKTRKMPRSRSTPIAGPVVPSSRTTTGWVQRSLASSVSRGSSGGLSGIFRRAHRHYLGRGNIGSIYRRPRVRLLQHEHDLPPGFRRRRAPPHYRVFENAQEDRLKAALRCARTPVYHLPRRPDQPDAPPYRRTIRFLSPVLWEGRDRGRVSEYI